MHKRIHTRFQRRGEVSMIDHITLYHIRWFGGLELME